MRNIHVTEYRQIVGGKILSAAEMRRVYDCLKLSPPGPAPASPEEESAVCREASDFIDQYYEAAQETA